MTEPAVSTARPFIQVRLAEAAPRIADRLVSLDVFRGITIAGMLVVNNPGTWSAIYPPLRHAEWHGRTPTDLMCRTPCSPSGVRWRSRLRAHAQGMHQAGVMRGPVVRGAVLVGLVLALHGFPWTGYG